MDMLVVRTAAQFATPTNNKVVTKFFKFCLHWAAVLAAVQVALVYGHTDRKTDTQMEK